MLAQVPLQIGDGVLREVEDGGRQRGVSATQCEDFGEVVECAGAA